MGPCIQAIAGCICFILLLTLTQAQDSYFHEKYSTADDVMPPVPNGVIAAIVIFGLVVALEDMVQWWYYQNTASRVEHEDPETGIPAAMAYSQPAAMSRAVTAGHLEEALFLVPCTAIPSTALYPQEHYDRDQPVLYIMEHHPVSLVTELSAEAIQ